MHQGPISMNHDIELYHAPSQLSGAFMESKNIGVFTKNFIPKGTILPLNCNNPSMLNDGMINLTRVLNAKTSDDIYAAMKELEIDYYNEETANNMINVRMTSSSERAERQERQENFYEALKDIPADTELLRMYGHSSWIIELLPIITEDTAPGFLRYINELNLDNDPLQMSIMMIKMHLCTTYKGCLDTLPHVTLCQR